MRLSNRTEKQIIVLLTLLAFLLRAFRLGFQSYWIDEAWSVYFANLPIGELMHLLKTVELTPPVYHPSTVYWVRLVGDSEYGLRFYSLVFGVMAIPLTYRLGKDLGDCRLGLLAALLLAADPYQVWHSQDARMYSILTAASVMSMWGFVNLWRRGGWRWWLIYVVGTEWAIMTHFHGGALIGVQGLFLLFSWRHRLRQIRQLVTWVSGLAAVVLILVPWLLYQRNLLQSLLQGYWLEQPTLWGSLVRSAVAFSVGELVPDAQAIPLTIVFVIVYALGLLYAARRSWGAWHGSEVLGLLVAYTIAPVVATWLYGQFRTAIYYERYLIHIQVGYLLTIAAGVLAIADGLRRYVGRGAPIVAGAFTIGLVGIHGWVLGHHYFDLVYAKPDWRAVARTVEEFEQPGDAIIITGDSGDKAFNYYYQGDLPVYLDFNFPAPPESQAVQIVADIASSHNRIWYTPYGVGIDHVLESWLAENAYPAWQSWLGRKRLALYAGSSVITDRLEGLDANLTSAQGQSLILESVAMPAGAIVSGDVLPLNLSWLAVDRLQEDYKLSLRLSNEQGDIFAQSDWPPLAAIGSTTAWKPQRVIKDRRGLWLPPDIPPGDYVLNLVVYDPGSGQPLGPPIAIPDLKVGPAETIVPPDVLSIPNRVQINLGDLNLVGYALPESIKPGEEMWLWLYWQATSAGLPPSGSTIRLSLTSEGEAISSDLTLLDSVGPLESWQPGQVRRAIYHVPTSPRLQGNRAYADVALISGEGQLQAKTRLAPIKLQARSRQFKAPSIAHRTEISFGASPQLELIGYDLPLTNLAPGGTLSLTLYWQAKAEMESNYTVFVQLLNSNQQVVAQQDLQPQSGAAPTTTWLPGEILTDPYTLSLPSDLSTGEYRIITGMYDSLTGQRMPVSTGEDFVELGTVTIP